jgi:hypothetical protein
MNADLFQHWHALRAIAILAMPAFFVLTMVAMTMFRDYLRSLRARQEARQMVARARVARPEIHRA